MRLVVAAIDRVDRSLFGKPPLHDWFEQFELPGRCGRWPTIEELDDLRLKMIQADGIERPRFVVQSVELLNDGLHYEERILRGQLATRENNWHDLLNALVWLRYPRIKHALNLAQCKGIARIGRRERSRAQYAMTHFDEAGAVVLSADPNLIALWDRHDWPALFRDQRSAWGSRIAVQVFGHAILELALQPQRLLVAKCVVLMTDQATIERLSTDVASVRRDIDSRMAERIAAGSELTDPQDQRPLPLSGIPGWHADTDDERFYIDAPCFRPLRPGRRYPSPDWL
ncbi:MAG TPA: DUF3025 domain-containing protein [Dokdonella sp.]|uniref:DUF3025 domain-containing protein n=1 Tax=Dokdonella sp. TaxID=2291710 RepID=UPI002D7F727A|nr:DUF3025 domain-containing protein [Dokdonella sp.]HET9032348.1 DUF3025 domain-containing protein [Dokdonella sp.]